MSFQLRWRRTGWVLGALALTWAAVAPAQPSGQAQRRREVNEQLETVKVRLVNLTSQYEELQRQRNENLVSAKALQEELAGVSVKNVRAVESLNRIRLGLRQAETAHAEHLDRFAKGLAQFYKLKNRPFLSFLINSKDVAEFSRRYKYLQYVFQQDYLALEKLQNTRRELAAKQAAVEAASRELDLARQQKETKGLELTATIDRGQEILESLAKEKQKALERARQLQASLDYIDTKIRQVSRDSVERPRPAPVTPLSVTVPPDYVVPGTSRRSLAPGRVGWPLDTRQEIQIVRTYGQSRSETGSLYFNPGIDIQVGGRQQVRAVGGGKVMHRGDMPNFGKVVFVDHGGNPDKIISIYGNLDEILVPVGQEVARGQVLGTVGSTDGNGHDATLHFEIRQNAVHQDPLKWLQGGRQMNGRNR
ncbi:MAG: peptidoglycan DD-metalloendopeptidase family protein [Candidatus Riflebacteria bacterium]|nr:peptidoglycan DD-metalloendopeptidase family protein [Candidatus Riflebacteria bacterium]